MKQRKLWLVLFVSVFLVCAIGTQAYAQTRASSYVEAYSVSAQRGTHRGEVDIEAMITSNYTVPKIGVLKIEIYQSNGTHITTIQGSTSNGLLASKSSFIHGLTYTYTGVPGTSYYAKVTLCAGTASDYDTRLVRPQTVKAPS